MMTFTSHSLLRIWGFDTRTIYTLIIIFCYHPYQQHALPLSSEHPHVGSLPVNQPVIVAAAQPTPAFTSIASDGQFNAQAPHSIQESFSAIRALPLLISNTPCGQTSVQRLQPMHLAASKASVVTLFRYLCLISFSSFQRDERRASTPRPLRLRRR